MRTAFFSLFLAVCAGNLHAQRSNGYIFFAPGGVNCCGEPTAMTLQGGFGGEWVIGKGIGAGGELSALGTREYFTESVVGVVSPNGYYHFIHNRDRKLDPFVTAGYSMMFRNGHANMYNFGGGMHYWFRNALGLRLEFRDQVLHGGYNPTVHYWGFRVGLVF
jgi:hypothetical protein